MRSLLVATLILFLGVGCVQLPSDSIEATLPTSSTVEFPSGIVVTVDLADDDWERAQGLSGRPSLEKDEGLLFLHDVSAIQRYWMKDMLISIDIIWIDQDRVVGFVESAQTENPPTTIYSSTTAVDKVLEVSAGFVSENNVKIGDILDIRLLNE